MQTFLLQVAMLPMTLVVFSDAFLYAMVVRGSKSVAAATC